VTPASMSRVREGLGEVSAASVALGMPALPLAGQLLRPLLTAAGAARFGVEDSRLWRAAAAVQYVHEASLVHDDVVDGAASRRGETTVAAARGVGAAVVLGDHFLAAGYRLAAATGSRRFSAVLARAVERTIAGELAQAKSAGRTLSDEEYRRTVAGKSGELTGCALSAGAYLARHPDAPALRRLGVGIGVLYQRLDDLLDYCPAADTGKPALGDHGRRLWTWPLSELEPGALNRPADRVVAELFNGAPGDTAADRCVARLATEAAALERLVGRLLPGDDQIVPILRSWVARGRAAVHAERRRRAEVAAQTDSARAWLAGRVPSPDAASLDAFFGRNSRSFRFAARLFDPAVRLQVSRVYAWCRITDDLADEDPGGPGDAMPVSRERLLEVWLDLARRAYAGEVTGLGLVDAVMADAAAAGVSLRHAEELVAGMGMDLRGERYADLAELRRYTDRVAATVGRWLTELVGVRDPAVLARATELGHGLQLTNIMRDVGEDWRAGRLYLPADRMAVHGVTERDVARIARGGYRTAGYKALMEEMLRVAESHYDAAWPGIAHLPPAVARAVAVAASVYGGIHREIRRADYDNGLRRARTSGGRKLLLAATALWRARGAGRPPSIPGATPRSAGQPGDIAHSADPALPARFGIRPRAASTAPPAAVATGPWTAAALAVLVLGALSLPVAGQDPAGVQWHEQVDSLLSETRGHFFAAVTDREPVEAGLRAAAALRAAAEDAGRHELADAARVYQGAFLLYRARDGRVGPTRLRDLRAGLALQDSSATTSPGDAEIRYVRLMSGYHLPGVFRRGRVVREDMAALAELLPGSRQRFPPALYAEAARFLLEHGRLSKDSAAALEESLR
jgi:15-cis-phytoene synthase